MKPNLIKVKGLDRTDSKQSVLDHIQRIKMDALPNIFHSHNPLMILFWTLLLLINATACAWLIIDTFKHYFERSVTTTTRYLTELESVFPSLIICSFNPFSTDYAVSLLREISVQSYNEVSLGSITGNYALYTKIQAFKNSSRGYYLTDEEKKALSNIDSMLISCSFKGNPCSSSDFELMFHPQYLVCYKYNGNGNNKISVTGPSTSLNIEV